MINLPLKTTIIFNENITDKQLNFYFYQSWKKRIFTFIKVYLFLLIITYIIDDFREKNYTINDYLQFAKGFTAVYFAFLFIYFIYAKLNYQDKIGKSIKEQIILGNTETTLVFDQDYFEIQCNSFAIKSNWSQITYKPFSDRLFLNIKLATPFTYIIDQSETSHYAEIIEILKEKSILEKQLN